MPRNIEIKARINELKAVHAIAAALSGQPVKIIFQEDIFFQTENGRLKLRILSPLSGELIFYQRDNSSGPKTSTYQVVKTDEPDALRQLLKSAYGEKSIVRKQRYLYLVGRTRIHIDAVEKLGDFIELEVMLADSETPEQGEVIAREFMQKLKIESSDLVEGAYADLLESQNS